MSSALLHLTPVKIYKADRSDFLYFAAIRAAPRESAENADFLFFLTKHRVLGSLPHEQAPNAENLEMRTAMQKIRMIGLTMIGLGCSPVAIE